MIGFIYSPSPFSSLFPHLVALEESEVQLGPGNSGHDPWLFFLGLYSDADPWGIYFIPAGSEQVMATESLHPALSYACYVTKEGELCLFRAAVFGVDDSCF